MNKKSIFCGIFSIAVCFSAAAQPTFMRSIDMDNDADVGLQIMRMEDGYLILVGGKCNNNEVDCIGILRTDFEGNDIYKRIHNAYPQSTSWQPVPYNGMARINGRYFLSGNIYRPGLEFQVFLMEIDPATGDSLSYLEQGQPGRELNRVMITTADENLVLYNFLPPSDERIWLQKWTPGMELLWERFIGPAFRWQGATAIVELEGGDFLLSRRTCDSSTVGPCFEQDLTLTRTDSTGNEMWTYTHLERVDDTWAAMVAMDSGMVAVSWARDMWDQPGFGDPFPPSVLWFDGEVELVHRYDFPTSRLRRIYNLRRAANGDLLGIGYGQWPQDGLGLTGWVFRLSPQAELLWERHIADLRSPIKQSIFYDIIEDPDGSLVLTGLYQDTFPNYIPTINNPNVWLVRLDSTGCLEPGCAPFQIITSTQEVLAPDAEKPMLIAAPNPADGFFALHLPGFAQPVFPLQVRLWDMQGRQVQAFTAQEYPVFVRTDHLPPGMYVAQVRTAAGQMGVAKVVIRG